MARPTTDGGNPDPIDRPILEFLQRRLRTTRQVERATISDEDGHLELRVSLAAAYYPTSVRDADLSIRWSTNDDFTLHYRERHPDEIRECRWDRHPNPHNTRDHFHPPPTAATPGTDADWSTDHRDVLTTVFARIETRIDELWSE